MVASELKVGDAAWDLLEGGILIIVEKAADSVAEFAEREDFDLAGYKAHPLIDVQDDEPVYTAVYVPSQPTVSFSGTYDFPASRLCRVPVEEANAELQRVQRGLAVALISDLFERAFAAGNEQLVEDLGAIASEAFGSSVADEARELAEVDRVVTGGQEADR